MSDIPMSRRPRRRGDGPARLVEAEGERILSREDCDEIFQRVKSFAKGGGETEVTVSSWWQGELRWALNHVNLASDRRDSTVTVVRRIHNGMLGGAMTNQLDDRSLEAAVRAAERGSGMSSDMGHDAGFHPELPEYQRPDGAIWSDVTYGLSTERRGEVARTLIAPAEAKGMLSAGYLEVRAASSAVLGDAFPELRRRSGSAMWEEPYNAWTQAQCSTTVRDKRGLGSGWAGLSSFDWTAIDAGALGARALEKCIASQNPVALEPGRYMVILEPQAVAGLTELLVPTFMRERPEVQQAGPWLLGLDDATGLWRSKLGLKVVDERITISHDTADPALGIVARQTEQPGKVTFIDRGVLTALGHKLETDIATLRGSHHLRDLTGYRMSGGETSVEEMIRTTRRGLLVTRFSNVRGGSTLATGLTRDGLWLVENGKITKAVKNFRFTESPLFVLNAIEQLGTPVPVFRPTLEEGGALTPAIVPPLKVRDFSFTSTIDAI
jgi:Predicted Zn-dependent proteases and their inactivated homologs